MFEPWPRMSWKDARRSSGTRFDASCDKSHAFERETIVEAKPVTGSDEKVDEIKGTQETRIPGDNVRAYRQRVQRRPGDSEPGE